MPTEPRIDHGRVMFEKVDPSLEDVARDDDPVVSVIVPAHNAADTIGLQLESLSVQRTDVPFEVIVVDNASTDDLAAAVEPFRDRLDVRIVRADERRGAAYARNVGIREARAEMLFFCDADDSVDPFAIENTRRTLEELAVFSGSAIPAVPEVMDRGLEGARSIAPGTETWSAPVPESEGYPILCGGVFGIRRVSALEVGGMDASFPWGGEDNDLAWRLTRAGHQVLVSKVVSIAYRQRPDGATSARAMFRAGWSHALLCMRHGIWGRTPATQGRRWVLEPARVAGAAVLALLRPGRASRAELTARFALSMGLLLGRLRFSVRAFRPRPLIGAGFDG